MLKLLSSILFCLLILFPHVSIAEEVEQLMVPETIDTPPDAPTEDNIQATEEATHMEKPETKSDEVPLLENKIDDSNTQEEAPQEVQEEYNDVSETPTETETEQEDIEVENVPSQDEIEARQAEEAELREAGAGEEPQIEE